MPHLISNIYNLKSNLQVKPMYGLLGEHLSHSFSPQIHARLGDYDYKLFEAAPDDLPAFLQTKNFNGLNVTIPYKKAVIPYLAGLSDNARRIGAVNTILKRADGTLWGDNTDYDGFLYMVRRSSAEIQGKKALVLGTGGASAPVAAVLSDLGAREVIKISRSGENNYENISRHFDADILVNTTPVGMYPNNGKAPLSLAGFRKLSCVLDIIYNPHRTALTLDAERRGIPAFTGLSMLVAQAKRAAELFLGENIPDARTDEILSSLEREMQNLVLVGMPGCGKTTVGQAIAKVLSRPFCDADTEIERRAGQTIPEIFEAEGEAGFRARETAALADICRQSGAVIATGGGAVTIPENIDILRQNSIVLFLNRDPSALPTVGRPVSQRDGVQAIYQRRLPLYRAVCDYEIDANDAIETVVQRILEAIQ